MKPDQHQQQFGGSPAEIRSFRGIRTWEASRDEPSKWLLTGITGYRWLPGENLASCKEGLHPVASPDCSCGFYAFWEMTEWLRVRSYRVIGVIDGYGDVTIGTKGFRCSKARILAMVLPGANYSTLGLDRVYPDVRVFPDIPSMLAEFPPSTIEDLETHEKR